MIFNPDLTKQVVIFSRKKLRNCFTLVFHLNSIPLKNTIFKEHLGLTLDVKLNFVELIKNITQKISKIMGLLGRFQSILPRSSP